MSYVKCNACLSPEACNTTIPENSEKPGMCWNAYANLKAYESQRAAAKAISINDPALAAHPLAQANAASWPGKAPRRPVAAPASAPGEGSVTARIFAACEAELSRLGNVKAARAAAIPLLEAAGVNGNSARKGSSMWAATKS